MTLREKVQARYEENLRGLEEVARLFPWWKGHVHLKLAWLRWRIGRATRRARRRGLVISEPRS